MVLFGDEGNQEMRCMSVCAGGANGISLPCWSRWREKKKMMMMMKMMNSRVYSV